MRKLGTVDLPLHGGKAPYWLLTRMKRLAHAIFAEIVDEFGVNGAIERLADPLWFQALSCALAYDWHSSGTTTVLCGVLKSVIEPEEFGFGIAGGKGKASRATLADIEAVGEKLRLSDAQVEDLKYASRISAKVDNACIQDGYQLYHHTMLISERGDWAVIQQGMNPEERYARRYHWLSASVEQYVEEPHRGIVGVQHETVLDLTAKASRGCRKVSVELARTAPGELERALKTLQDHRHDRLPGAQTRLPEFEPGTAEAHPGRRTGVDVDAVRRYRLPRRVNWDALFEAYDTQPANYEQVLAIRGMGPATVRALALVAELIYGEPASWQDPVKYSFAFGGKDGVPYPVDTRTMDETTELLRAAMQQVKVNAKVPGYS